MKNTNKTRFLLYIFVAALIIRITLALFLYKAGIDKGLDGFFYGGDDFAYGDTALKLAARWTSGEFPVLLEIKKNLSLSNTMEFYQYYLAILMLISNNCTFLPIFINCIFGTLSVLIVYLIVTRMSEQEKPAGRQAALLAAAFSAFWPSLIFWSTLNFKDAPTIFFLLTLSLATVRIAKGGFKIKGLTANIICFAVSWYVLERLRIGIRPLILIAVMLGAAAWFMSAAHQRWGRITKILIAAGIFTGAIILFRNMDLLNNIAQIIDRERNLRALGASVIMPDLKLGSLTALTVFFPSALAVAFLYPLPNMASSFIGLFSIPEMLVWYGLLFFFAKGFIRSVTARSRETYFLIFFTIVYYLALGFLDANAGTLFRHRALILPISFIFIAAGLQKENVFSKRTV